MISNTLLDSPAPLHVREDFNRVFTIAVVVLLGLVDVAWIMASPMRFSWQGVMPGVVVSTILIVVSTLYTVSGRSERIANLAFDGFLLVAFSHVGCIYSYLVVSNGGILWDEAIIAMDTALGFDWRAYTNYFLSHPGLRYFALIAYSYTLLLVALTVAWLSLTGRVGRSREFLTSIVVGGVLCISFALLLPTAGAVGYFLPDDTFYRSYSVTVDTRFMAEYFSLRSTPDHIISLQNPKGFIAFPSYHSCMAVLIVLAYREMRMMLALMIVLNVATLISVPVEGGHHLMDAVGGVLVAFVAYFIARRLAGTNPQRLASA